MFEGFGEPKENWSKLPHEFIDALPDVTTLGEMKVILYILRHTWGYRDNEKRLTLDEFMNGRKRADGSRIDQGCGMAKNSIRLGIELAIEHGFILMNEDGSDQGRIKRWYSLNSNGQFLTPRGSETDTPGGQKLIPSESEVDPRTEKETKERNQGKERAAAATRKNDPAYGEVCTKYENEIGVLSPSIADSLKMALYDDEMPAGWICAAIDEAVANNVRNWKYVSKILARWKVEGKDTGTKAEATAKKETAQLASFWGN